MNDGTIRYCSQENLKLLTDSDDIEISHESVPFFFSEKKKGMRGYELNKYTREIFPSDELFRENRCVEQDEENLDMKLKEKPINSGIDRVIEASEKELIAMIRKDETLSSIAMERIVNIWKNEKGEDAAKLLEVASKAMNENEMVTADVIHSELYESYPDWSYLLYSMAHHAFVQEDYDRALELCEKSLDSNPNFLVSLNNLVEYNLALGNIERAKHALDLSLKTMPFANIWPPELLNSLLNDMDDDDGGRVDFDESEEKTG